MLAKWGGGGYPQALPELVTIYEIADLAVLLWMISQKCSKITNFKDFEETFRNECSECNERRGTSQSGVRRGPL